MDVQALACSIIGFLFAFRSATLVAISDNDVSYENNELTIVEQVRKSQDTPRLDA